MTERRRTIIARRLRRDATDAERVLWRALAEAKLPYRFRRQHPIGNHIVDFSCPARKPVIELDGGQHGVHTQADDARTEELARHGYRVIRFWNNDVSGNLEGVLETIGIELARDPPHPALSALKGGEG